MYGLVGIAQHRLGTCQQTDQVPDLHAAQRGSVDFQSLRKRQRCAQYSTVYADGSIDIYLQNTEPATMQRSWLPAPKAPFGLVLRIYWPGEALLNGM
jgi:hypothetical protein